MRNFFFAIFEKQTPPSNAKFCADSKNVKIFKIGPETSELSPHKNNILIYQRKKYATLIFHWNSLLHCVSIRRTFRNKISIFQSGQVSKEYFKLKEIPVGCLGQPESEFLRARKNKNSIWYLVENQEAKERIIHSHGL